MVFGEFFGGFGMFLLCFPGGFGGFLQVLLWFRRDFVVCFGGLFVVFLFLRVMFS